MAQETTSTSSLTETFRVGVRIPPFYPEMPGLWFSQMEAKFTLANIRTDKTKFFYVVGNLDAQYPAEVEDVISYPPPADKYDKLKAELIKRLSASCEKKVKQLLMHEELGDLAGPGVPEEFLRTSRLPSSTQAIIASQSKTDLTELAELADRIHDVVGTQVGSTVAVTCTAAAPGTSGGAASTEIAALTRQLEKLADKLHPLIICTPTVPTVLVPPELRRAGETVREAVQLPTGGKCSGQSVMATDDCPSAGRLFITDQRSKEHLAFQKCKDSLCQAAMLAHPDCNAKLALVTDASDKAMGSVLQQLNKGAWEPLAFFSLIQAPRQLRNSFRTATSGQALGRTVVSGFDPAYLANDPRSHDTCPLH
ncbi:unnamed protein product [Pieris brassicae]|uniref:Reverse transcriptase/retrotransposon-derived protein RNase H-like domain-containing protein n=1 Tax=Pieris brassicae TaxID=7116 RepID=A0A9P0U0I0_PIEBR|nr:unnamed protein product [Pieris brassicae]